MRRADILCAGAILALALVVVGEGLRLGIGWGTDGPAPGFFVFYLGLTLALACGAILVRAWAAAPSTPPRPFVTRARLAPVATVVLPAAAMVAATHLVGLYVAGAMYLGGYMRWLGHHSWALTVAVSLLIPVVAFLVFEIWFLVPMPKGPLETALGY